MMNYDELGPSPTKTTNSLYGTQTVYDIKYKCIVLGVFDITLLKPECPVHAANLIDALLS